MVANVLDVLMERGFVKDISDERGLRSALENPITMYIGFDPTASSLHVGNLLSIMVLAWMQRLGHRPIALVGGGTGLVGDPTGRTTGRPMLTYEQIEDNLKGQKAQLARYIDFSEGRALMVNNAEWLRKLNYIEFLRDIGVHFSVNHMLATETYKTKLASESGLSFLEFNYALLQAYDFLHLYQEYDCILQMGGSDQWANSLAGTDLIRKVEGGQAYVMVTPLITTASGAKMGKSQSGSVWLDPELTSPYQFYQYWINTEDPDVERFLALYTFLPMEEVRRLGELRGAELRKAKEVLAFEATRLSHGEEAAREALEASRSLFGGDAGSMKGVPTTTMNASELAQGIPASQLFAQTGLAVSRGEARRLIQQGGAYVNGDRVENVEQMITPHDLVDGSLFLRAGKKKHHRIVVE
ncbi:MAG TPA: tyrosine--tRNA ligase [Chloroflexota bacterium]|nr:tyrosine--tRNA ligase [Chloroflexota bacterium]